MRNGRPLTDNKQPPINNSFSFQSNKDVLSSTKEQGVNLIHKPGTRRGDLHKRIPWFSQKLRESSSGKFHRKGR
jgi:hypothetical protein